MTWLNPTVPMKRSWMPENVPIGVMVVFASNVATGAAFRDLFGFGNTAMLLVIVPIHGQNTE